MTKRFAMVPIAAASTKGLGEHGLRVLIALAAFCDRAGRCWPSLMTIAAAAEIDRRHVPAALAKLENVGLITRSRTGKGKSTSYTVVYSKVSRQDVTGQARGVTPRYDRVSRPDVTLGPLGVTSRRALTDQDSEQTIEQTTLLPSARASENPEIDLAVQAWNALATEIGLPTVRKLTKPLRSSLRARLSECGGIEGWQEVLKRIRGSEFLRGAGSSGWRASLQWTAKPENFEKIVAGNYDRSARAGRGNGKGNALMDALDRQIDEADRETAETGGFHH